MKKINIIQNLSGFDKKIMTEFSIDKNNWANDYPYSPEVKAYMAHNSDNILLLFEVLEDVVMAKVKDNNGEVYTDSCVEFFISFDNKAYYNFEFSCIGKILASYRKGRDTGVEYLSDDMLGGIYTKSSLGNDNFDEKSINEAWTLMIKLPKNVFFKHNIESLSSLKAKVNLYKCGDGLSKPHYLSWMPINTEKPNFHQPQFFGDILFDSGL